MPSKIPRRITKNLCRIIGIIHGDGNMSSSRIHITDKCHEYHIKVIKHLFKETFNLDMNLFHDKNRNSCYSHVKDKRIYNYLTKKLEIPKGSVRNNLKVPEYLKSFPDNLKASYISGLFDAESYISKRQAEINFSTTCQEIFEFIKEFLNKKNIEFSMRIRDRRKNKEYEIYIYGKNRIKSLLKVIELRHPDKLSQLHNLSLVH